jgi:hypothetical protein
MRRVVGCGEALKGSASAIDWMSTAVDRVGNGTSNAGKGPSGVTRRTIRSPGDPIWELLSASWAVGGLLSGRSVSPQVRNGAVNGETVSKISRSAQKPKRRRMDSLYARARHMLSAMTGRRSHAWSILIALTTVSSPLAAPRQAAGPTAAIDAAAEVVAFERAIEDAVVRGDVHFVDAATAPTFTFTHGDGWTTGGAPLRVDSRADWLATVAKAPYASRVLDSVKTEVHGDIVITYGRYVARFKNAELGRRQFTVWFERVYAKRDGRWQYLSHRTVHGPIYDAQ